MPVVPAGVPRIKRVEPDHCQPLPRKLTVRMVEMQETLDAKYGELLEEKGNEIKRLEALVAEQAVKFASAAAKTPAKAEIARELVAEVAFKEYKREAVEAAAARKDP